MTHQFFRLNLSFICDLILQIDQLKKDNADLVKNTNNFTSAKDSLIADLKKSNNTLSIELANLQVSYSYCFIIFMNKFYILHMRDHEKTNKKSSFKLLLVFLRNLILVSCNLTIHIIKLSYHKI